MIGMVESGAHFWDPQDSQDLQDPGTASTSGSHGPPGPQDLWEITSTAWNLESKHSTVVLDLL